jgi:hypothetical protein
MSSEEEKKPWDLVHVLGAVEYRVSHTLLIFGYKVRTSGMLYEVFFMYPLNEISGCEYRLSRSGAW